MPQELTSKTFVRMPDGSLVPVSTICHVGAENQTVEPHLSRQQWEELVQTLMDQISRSPR